jgi:response regulator RpfG family c-di-GMP phosphodiesterase
MSTTTQPKTPDSRKRSHEETDRFSREGAGLGETEPFDEELEEWSPLTEDTYCEYPTVLFVDDEPHILKAITRMFDPLDYEVWTAEGGPDAIELLEARDGEPAVVVADQRMPEMPGSELLAHIRENYPDIVRVMLTGNENLDTAISAINRGHVFRFITKPWDHDEFLQALDDAVEYNYLRVSKRRNERYIARQNERLRELNDHLECRVQERTAELQQSHREVKRLYGELESSFDKTIKAMMSIMELGDIQIVDHCQRTTRWVEALAVREGLSEEASRDLKRAALLHWIGLIAAPSTIFEKPVVEYDAEERATWEFHPVLGQQAISHIPALHRAGAIIVNYLKPSGPPVERAAAESVEWPDECTSELVSCCEILRVCSLYERVRTRDRARGDGRNQHETMEAGLELLDTFRGAGLNSKLVDALQTIVRRDVAETERERVLLSPAELEPGMVLSRPLETNNGQMIAPRDFQVTENLIGRLTQLEETERLEAIHVWNE